MMHTMHCAPATRERDYINKYEHIGLREGMHNVWKTESRIQHSIKEKVNVLPLMLLFLLYVKFAQILITFSTMEFNSRIFNTFED